MATILIADDDRDVSELVAFLLERDGHAVHTVTEGDKILEAVGKIKPELILLDVMMPGMDGYSVAIKLSEDAVQRDVPVMVLTAKGKMRDLFLALPNVKAYIEKPFEPAILRTKVRAVLGI